MNEGLRTEGCIGAGTQLCRCLLAHITYASYQGVSIGINGATATARLHRATGQRRELRIVLFYTIYLTIYYIISSNLRLSPMAASGRSQGDFGSCVSVRAGFLGLVSASCKFLGCGKFKTFASDCNCPHLVNRILCGAGWLQQVSEPLQEPSSFAREPVFLCSRGICHDSPSQCHPGDTTWLSPLTGSRDRPG